MKLPEILGLEINILVPVAVATPGRVGVCIPAQAGERILAQEADCTPAPVMNLIEAIYRLGPFSLIILRNTE
jgi:hypothetical protein